MMNSNFRSVVRVERARSPHADRGTPLLSAPRWSRGPAQPAYGAASPLKCRLLGCGVVLRSSR